MSELNSYRVKGGKRFGAGGKYGPGEIVSLPPALAAPFLDKLEPVSGEATVTASAGTTLPADAPRPYRVKSGKRFGAGGRYGPGEIVNLLPLLAARFLDKLEPCALPDQETVSAAEDAAADAAADAGEEAAADVVGELPVAAVEELPADGEAQNVANARMDTVMEWVTGGQMTAGDALDAERASRRPRPTLIRALEALLP